MHALIPPKNTAFVAQGQGNFTDAVVRRLQQNRRIVSRDKQGAGDSCQLSGFSGQQLAVI